MNDQLHAMRHSAAHVMAEAIQSIWPAAQFAYGPETDDGFYYDVLIPGETIKEEDLPKIEKRMKRLIQKKSPFLREELPRDEALKLFAGQKFKVDTIENKLADEATVTVYRQGDFVDLCAGPHVESSGAVGAVKLSKLAGAYWLGDADNEQLQRVYGFCFPTQEELDRHVTLLEEAKRRDHRTLARSLKLFSWHDEGPGFPFMLPGGKTLFNLLIDYNRKKNDARGYVEVSTPQMLDVGLWQTSGHAEYYRENMYFSDVDEREFAVKPMNCPGSVLVYGEERRSYRELPLRMAEFGLVHRHELSGVLHGLFRVRAFTQDDAHVYCVPDDLERELIAIVDYTIEVYRDFGFDEYVIYIATRPEKAIGDEETWDKATDVLKRALDARGIAYRVKEGEGAFYGPKIEFNVKDAIGRQWQLGTAQLDFFLPERFGMEYIGADGETHRPVMIHRAIFGSLERFLGILIEHTMGAFPVWLAPTQAIVIPITDEQNDYAADVAARLKTAGLRAEADFAGERMQKKIRNAQMRKIPYMLVAGGREAEEGNVSVRLRTGEDLGSLPVDAFIAQAVAVAQSRGAALWPDAGA
jgi:threonyl-tRNA synthetase